MPETQGVGVRLEANKKVSHKVGNEIAGRSGIRRRLNRSGCGRRRMNNCLSAEQEEREAGVQRLALDEQLEEKAERRRGSGGWSDGSGARVG